MGCGSSKTKEEEIKDNLLPILKKMQELVDQNPLFEEDYDDILKIIKKYENEDLLTIYSYISKELSILYFFCANGKNNSIRKKKHKYLKNLLNTAIQKNELYYSWKLSNIITNIIQFSLFCFIYLFGSRAILIQTNNFPTEGLELIYVDKKSFRGVKPEIFSEYVTNQINFLCIGNENHHKIMLPILLSNVFQPISEIIINDPNLEIAEIEDEKMNKIIENLSKILDADGIFNHLFYLRIHDYAM